MRRLLSAHMQAQVLRFVRVSALALLTQLMVSGWSWPGWAGPWVLVAGAAEAGLRQVWPVLPIPKVASVPTPPPGSSGGTP